MEIKVYLHRTRKHDFKVAECLSVIIDFDKLPIDKRKDVDFINAGFQNDAKRLAMSTTTVKKYGTGYISVMIPKYEGPEEENGTEDIYFDNKEMLFRPRITKK